MSTAREAILGRVRTALGDVARPAASGERSSTSANDARPAEPASTLVERFIVRVTDYGSSVYECEPQGLAATVAGVCAEHGAQRLACPADLPTTWRPPGVELIADEPALSPAELDDVDGVLTGSAAAAAETGTVALDHGPGQGRRALSLLPDLHVCVLEAAAIVPDVPELIAALGPAVSERRPVTLISGPSATSDIELDRVEGVHGPRRLAIVLLTPPRSTLRKQRPPRKEDIEMKSLTLVTGAGGCIGAWTIRQLLAEETPVLALDLRREDRRLRLLVDEEALELVSWVQADVTDLPALRRVLDQHAVGAVIHLAALQAPFCRADPPLGAAVNVVGTVNLLEALAARGEPAEPFVYASSIAAAAQQGETHPSTIYGVYKLACEGAADVYHREHGMASIGLRPHTVYGPGRDQGITSAPSLAMHAAAAGRGYEIPFTGRLTMQYAPDVAAAFIAASRAEGYEGAGVFDLPGDTVDVSEILSAIAAVAPDAAITSTGPPLMFPADVDFSPDAPFAHALSPTPLGDGVADAIARFRELPA